MAKTLTDLFFDQLQDAYSAETQLTKALPKMAKAANSAELRAGFEYLERRAFLLHLVEPFHCGFQSRDIFRQAPTRKFTCGKNFHHGSEGIKVSHLFDAQ